MRYLFILFFFIGCSFKQPIHSYPATIIFKTAKFKFAGSGFIEQKGENIVIKGYSAAQPLFKIVLAKRVCVNKKCLSYKLFNRLYLSSFYPPHLLKDIFLRRVIFNGLNKEDTKDGFEQKIVRKHLDIIYRISSKEIYFKDRKNHILIKVRKL